VTKPFELDVPTALRRSAHQSEQKWIRSAHELLALVQRSCGLSSFEGLSILDMGCGTKMTKALLEAEVPIARYVGMDVEPDVIEFLQSEVHDDRFAFRHIDVQNSLYNPHGLPLTERTELPCGDEVFDVIWLFSVFTHLDPTDYHAMLRLLRRYVADGGWLVYSLYINEVTGTGFGPVDWLVQREKLSEEARTKLAKAIEREIEERGEQWFAEEVERQASVHGPDWWVDSIAAAPEHQRTKMEAALGAAAEAERAGMPGGDDTFGRATRPVFVDEQRRLTGEGEPPDFVELIAESPLLEPLYSRSYAYELIEGTGWQVHSLNPPEPDYIQHYFVCRPT
jgi:SAM-dependent methyltransferase